MSASARSVGWRRRGGEQPGSRDRQEAYRQAEPVEQRLGTDLDRADAHDDRPELLGGEEDVEEPDRDGSQPDQPGPAHQRPGGRAR